MFYSSLRALTNAFKNPPAATRYLYVLIREAFVDKTGRVSELLGVSPNTAAELFLEIEESNLKAIAERRMSVRKGLPIGGMTTAGRGPVLYVICRLVRPKIVVETGVASGVSSSYILNALNKNGHGTLYSIDIPTPGEEDRTGWLIPEELRSQWRLIRGKSSDELQDLMNDLLEVDLFLHDSDHSYQNMMFEFETVWPHLREEGVLLSDDTHLNRSFFDFARSVNRKAVRFYLLAAIRK